MFVLQITVPDSCFGREYISEGGNLGYTNNLQKAHVFIETKDASIIPWPAEEADAADLECLLAIQQPKRIQVTNCDKCASVKFLTEACPVCEGETT